MQDSAMWYLGALFPFILWSFFLEIKVPWNIAHNQRPSLPNYLVINPIFPFTTTCWWWVWFNFTNRYNVKCCVCRLMKSQSLLASLVLDDQTNNKFTRKKKFLIAVVAQMIKKFPFLLETRYFINMCKIFSHLTSPPATYTHSKCPRTLSSVTV